LPHDATRTRPQGDAHSDFVLAPASTRQLQVRDISARDEQNESNCGQYGEQRYLLVAQKHVSQRRKAEAAILVIQRIPLLLPGGEHLHLGASARERNTVFQANENLEVMVVVICQLRRGVRGGNPDIRLIQ
jgi:hypothetical protein